jgi:hypothetical protein
MQVELSKLDSQTLDKTINALMQERARREAGSGYGLKAEPQPTNEVQAEAPGIDRLNQAKTTYAAETGRPGAPVYGMDFGHALDALKRGFSVTRQGWNGRGQWITLQRPDVMSKMSLPYIYIRTVQGDRVPWLASQTDILAEDWRPAQIGEI